ncbi:MAG TPA: sulfite oxidase [Terriglobales bacterium]|nr:sulfite oxidase [Terriglobales bacterium]
MSRWAETGKRILTTKFGRREFLLKALASGGLASSYLKARGLFLEGNPSLRSGAAATSPEIAKELVTSNIDFFIRNHFSTPQIDADKWALEIGGLVSSPLKLSYADLLLTASMRHPVTIECAGNRSGGGGVSTALWSGVPLAELLKQAGLRSGATNVVLYGADSGGGGEVPPGTHFARAIPLERAMDPSTLLAYEMNGEPLPADHGFPLRAVVPGWYGMDSVKWLTRIEVLDKPFDGYFQKEEYMALRLKGDPQPVTRMQVSSKFLRPSEGEEIRVKTYRVEGVAWAGEHKITKVEVRIDPGGVWQTANLAAAPVAMVWTAWNYDWNVARPGSYTLQVRATDEEGRIQPEIRDPERKDSYELNTPARVNVTVR